MNSRCFIAAIVGFIILISAHATQAQSFSGIDGKWEGTLTVVQGPHWESQSTSAQVWMSFEIKNESVRVFRLENTGIRELKEGRFRIVRLRTNAVIFAFDTGVAAEGEWVQSLVYAVAEKDQNTLIVNSYVMGNNLNVPASDKISKWTVATTGEFRRVTNGGRKPQ